MTNTHNTAPTQFINANGVRYAYRWLGATSGTPVVFLQHFRGGLDNWDPTVTDGLAKDRPVILFNNASVANSGGEPSNTVSGMAKHVIAFVNALGLTQIDLLGFSLGGFVAQEVALQAPIWSAASSSPAPDLRAVKAWILSTLRSLNTRPR